MIMYLSNYFVANPFQRQARLDRAMAMPAICLPAYGGRLVPEQIF